MKIDHLNSMDGYTFDEGIAFLVLVKAPMGVINHLKATHNRSHLHSEIHKQLRFPRVKEIVRRNMGNSPLISQKFPNEGTAETDENEPKSDKNEPNSDKNEPNSDENEPKSDKNEPKSDENEPNSDETTAPTPTESTADADDTDPTEIILIKEDVRTHENTRLEDMPNDLCRTLWQKRQDVYREMQQAHLKMRAVPEGEEHNEERARWRAEVLRLDAENDKYWKQIDAEIERFNDEKERADEKADKDDQTGFNVSTYRAYICKAIRKKQLSPEQFAELQHRVNAMLAAGVEMDSETIEKLKAKGITVD